MAYSLEIIKRHGQRDSEQFDHSKLHESIQAACLSVRTPVGEAEQIARHTTDVVKAWCQERSAVTSHDIRRVASQFLAKLHPEAAYMYETHQLVI